MTDGDTSMGGDLPAAGDAPGDNDPVTNLSHDVRNFFHSIEMSIPLLRASLGDEAHCNEILDILSRDHRATLPQLHALIDLARKRS